jgi:hypothetical protein
MVHLEEEGDSEEEAVRRRQAGLIETRHKLILNRHDVVIVCILTGSKSVVFVKKQRSFGCTAE